jgi:hypothetical protein
VLVEKLGLMTQFTKVPRAALFLTFIDGAQMYGMKIKTKTGLDAVLHLAGGDPKVVDEDHFANRDVFVLESPKFQFPKLAEAKSGNPDAKARGAVIFSAEGIFIRASHSQGPFDVELEHGTAQMWRNHPGSIWFDSWDVVVTRAKEDEEILFGHHRPKAKR